jgi:transcriptional regulator with XRE-family HTH domain
MRSARKERGEGLEAFAARVELERGAYAAIERGEAEITALTLKRIAAALGLPAAELLDRADRDGLPGGPL